MSFWTNKFFLIIMILISVAFITLLERKILAYIQIRKGPNKNFFIGFFQPFNDALKLFSKENLNLTWLNTMIFYTAPFFSLFLMLFIWLSINPLHSYNNNLLNDFLFLLLLSSMSVYPIIIMGWASNSKFSSLGSFRNVAQTISYETSFAFIALSFFIPINSLNFLFLSKFQNKSISFLFSMTFLCLYWLVTILAENNRTPFDFAESESELVSGFNTEYGSINFAIIFMAEYGNIIFYSYLTSIMLTSEFFFPIKLMFFMSTILWIRGTLPRFRYDNLMLLAWKNILPFSIMFFWLIFFIFM
uniref:NADH-ubiquinone oxidoreductase chain 1 n=1 Tax=Coleolaelaps cf. liui XFX-2019 TaxID=2695870 RepID=A0A6B9WCJ3_9ACAR|nr:NADH dehydrogenase subunit 1 [Coleolaelaps cf. liui XFX-2019]